MTIRADTSGLDDLAAEFDRAANEAAKEMYGVVKRGLQNIKTDWRRAARRSAGAHGKHYPRSIDYDIAQFGTRTDGEVGPNIDNLQGGMGRGFEYGSVNTAPKPDGANALAREEPKFITQAEAVATKLLPH